jgi:hypothetical protein
MLRHFMREKIFSKIVSARFSRQLWASFMLHARHELGSYMTLMKQRMLA